MLGLKGVFQLRENRESVREKLTSKGFKLELFVPEFTDDESEDHDCSEDES